MKPIEQTLKKYRKQAKKTPNRLYSELEFTYIENNQPKIRSNYLKLNTLKILAISFLGLTVINKTINILELNTVEKDTGTMITIILAVLYLYFKENEKNLDVTRSIKDYFNMKYNSNYLRTHITPLNQYKYSLLTKLSKELIENIEKDNFDFISNLENTEEDYRLVIRTQQYLDFITGLDNILEKYPKYKKYLQFKELITELKEFKETLDYAETKNLTYVPLFAIKSVDNINLVQNIIELVSTNNNTEEINYKDFKSLNDFIVELKEINKVTENIVENINKLIILEK